MTWTGVNVSMRPCVVGPSIHVLSFVSWSDPFAGYFWIFHGPCGDSRPPFPTRVDLLSGILRILLPASDRLVSLRAPPPFVACSPPCTSRVALPGVCLSGGSPAVPRQLSPSSSRSGFAHRDVLGTCWGRLGTISSPPSVPLDRSGPSFSRVFDAPCARPRGYGAWMGSRACELGDSTWRSKGTKGRLQRKL